MSARWGYIRGIYAHQLRGGGFLSGGLQFGGVISGVILRESCISSGLFDATYHVFAVCN